MIVELGLTALHEPGVIRGRQQLRKHGIAWIMGGVKGDIQMGEQGGPSIFVFKFVAPSFSFDEQAHWRFFGRFSAADDLISESGGSTS